MRKFQGKWITDSDFADLKPQDNYRMNKQLQEVPPDPFQNSHILFRKKFTLNKQPKQAKIYITADDYYKLYINGVFVSQGPAPAYPSRYPYQELDVSAHLRIGENVLAVHTYYQGIINRVWVSGDYRQGLLCDLVVDDELLIKSDESFLTHKHTAYSPLKLVGLRTQFMERYDSSSREIGFQLLDFDDSQWENARYRKYVDYQLERQRAKELEFETLTPVSVERMGKVLRVDFGKNYVGYLQAKAKGVQGELIKVRSGQELNEDGTVRYNMRCNCCYEEEWLLSGGNDELNQFDYKPLRFVEFECENEAEIKDVLFVARHYPFQLKATLRPEYNDNENLRKIWELCIHTQKYGVQEVIQDCPDREKGFYLGDGCYTALTHYILSGDDSMARKLIDDAFDSSFISTGLVTCMDCSFVQKIAEYPLILIEYLLWFYRISGDKEYLLENYKKAKSVMEYYRAQYEKDGLVIVPDRWSVVEWPANMRDGYAVDLREGKENWEAHVAINAYYIRAVHCMNVIAKIVGEEKYRDEASLIAAFENAFYDREKHIFYDSAESKHVSLIGNVFPYAFSLSPDAQFKKNFLELLHEKGYAQTSFFTSFPLLCGFVREGEWSELKQMLNDPNTWRRMLNEGATTTFEGWGKDLKKNASLFHLTFSDAAVFLADIQLKNIFGE